MGKKKRNLSEVEVNNDGTGESSNKRKKLESAIVPISDENSHSFVYFNAHFCQDIDGSVIKKIRDTNYVSRTSQQYQNVCNFEFFSRLDRNFADDPWMNKKSIEDFVFPKLYHNFLTMSQSELFEIQQEIYNVIGKYIDMNIIDSGDNLMVLYCLHTLNHVINTRNLVIRNNLKVESMRMKHESLKDEDIENIRDQGFFRPKVLILCPMKKYAFKIVDLMCSLLFGESKKTSVSNFQRFEEQFGDENYVFDMKREVSEDFKKVMSGNTDDCFRIGISVSKKALRLFTPFAESDIIIASPLGLRMIIDKSDEANETNISDYLSSIELLIVDKAELLFMQNWENVINLIDELHTRPQKLAVDISRIRHWVLNEQSRFYRQTLILSSFPMNECRAIFISRSLNYSGFVSMQPHISGMIDKIEVMACQELQRIHCNIAENQSDDRFNFFKEKILPKCEKGTMIFIPSYFDYVRIRNYLKVSNESFVQLNEYAKPGKVAKGRYLFFKGEKKLMLFTERIYFYKRYFIKGIKSVVFYQPPMTPSFYHEILNIIRNNKQFIVRLLFTKYDSQRMINIFGEKFYKQIRNSSKDFHALIAE